MSWFNFIASDVALDEFSSNIYKIGNRVNIINDDIALDIYREQYEGYPEQYTKLKNIVGIEIGKYENVRDELLAYIKKAVSTSNKLEVWSIWLGDSDKDMQVRNIEADELSEEDVDWIFDQEYYERPQCLKVYRWRRG